MKAHRHALPVLLVAVALVGGGWRGDETPDSRVVLVELFTSQGCSSCPPADRLLTELQQRLGDRSGLEIVPLSFHVDYWNRLGWRDPFSQEAFSTRQRQYAQWLQEGRVYTPQAVIGGGEHCVGSDVECLARWLRQTSATEPSAAVRVGASRQGEVVEVEVRVDDNHSGRPLVLYVALRQRGLITRVETGENARRTLTNDFVVRRLVALKDVEAGQTALSAESSLRIDAKWGQQPLDAVAFLQDPRNGRIYGAGQSSDSGERVDSAE